MRLNTNNSMAKMTSLLEHSYTPVKAKGEDNPYSSMTT